MLTVKPPHSARLRSNGVRDEKCCVGVSVTRREPLAVSCHQSSSSTWRMPADRTDRQLNGITTSGSVSLSESPKRPQIAVIVMIVAEQHRRDRRQVLKADARLADPSRFSPPWSASIR